MAATHQPGVAVDAAGGAVIDPTANVIALNDAANRRQDDLREAFDRRFGTEIAKLEAIIALRSEIAALRAEHSKEIREIETARVNAIRQVDVLAVSTAADRAAVAIQTLAATTAANADNLRSALATTAATIATQTASQFNAVTERIAALEKSSYEGKGKQAYADPAMAELTASIKALQERSAQGTGRDAGVGLAWAAVLGAVALIASVLAIVGFLK